MIQSWALISADTRGIDRADWYDEGDLEAVDE